MDTVIEKEKDRCEDQEGGDALASSPVSYTLNLEVEVRVRVEVEAVQHRTVEERRY